VRKNLIDGGYAGEIYPVNPRPTRSWDARHRSVADVPGE